MKKLFIETTFLLLFGISHSICLLAQSTKYLAEKGTIVGKNTGFYNNRPLYINNSNAFILTGDQPIARLVKGEYLYGTFMLAVECKGRAIWMQQCDQKISMYRAGVMAWKITDKAFPGLKIVLEILPMATTTGMAVRVNAEGVQQGDKVIWAFGGAEWRKGQNLSWKLDVMGQPELLTWGFTTETSGNNLVVASGKTGFVSLLDSKSNDTLFTVAGGSSTGIKPGVGESSVWNDAAVFKQSQPQRSPVLKGMAALKEGGTIYWAFEAFHENSNLDLSRVNDPENTFAEGLKRTISYQDRLKINTPDAYLNAVASTSVAAVDGTWYPPVFVHGALQWNVRYPGWRTIFGGTMYGWHDRVRAEAKFYTDSQIKTSDKKEAKADTALLLTIQDANSRFYGLGRIMADQSFYNMQTQFFDQIIEAYRWTNDPELIKFFRQALELHLQWEHDCFDPDDDGVYESYINVWPTDSQWYNGGGTAEETSYAYRGHLAARDMARAAGDAKAEHYHGQMLEKIKKGFFEKLWIKNKGYSGAYREQGGHERLHENPWLYSIFLPVECGMVSPLQAIESVYYSEWALQNDRIPAGGRKVWTSNWVPGTWSVRELWPGDNYALALAYFKAGLPNDGWDIMRGTFIHSAYDDLVPGNLGARQGGVDFGDCLHPFTRTLVSGLFGYTPDYPNNKVTIAPQFPSGWDHASIELPDVKIRFKRIKSEYNYSFKLARAANLELFLPVQCKGIKSVTVNGKAISWKLLPAVGRSMLQIQLSSLAIADVVIETSEVAPYYSPEIIEGNIGEMVQLKVKDARVIGYEDPQEILRDTRVEKDMLIANLAANKGYHTVVAQVMEGKATQWRVFRIKINDPEGERLNASRFVDKVPGGAAWESVDISPLLNADVTTIYQQKYLSPRLHTVSARLGADGYSPWTFPFWKSFPPVIKVDKVKNILDEKHQIVTTQGVPFIWNSGVRNIAFTSMWDNYPTQIDFPVNRTGNAIYFLVTGSTNVMQCQIANAVIRLNYADGQSDSLELVPPVNYWNLSPISASATGTEQHSRNDYTAEVDRFCLPAILPETVQLGENCRGMLLNLKLRKEVELKSVTLETLSQEVVVGLMGITLMN
ncbi:MAG: DUF4450 domain-containing protein [Agriterribacter sp.]